MPTRGPRKSIRTVPSSRTFSEYQKLPRVAAPCCRPTAACCDGGGGQSWPEPAVCRPVRRWNVAAGHIRLGGKNLFGSSTILEVVLQASFVDRKRCETNGSPPRSPPQGFKRLNVLWEASMQSFLAYLYVYGCGFDYCAFLQFQVEPYNLKLINASMRTKRHLGLCCSDHRVNVGLNTECFGWDTG